MSIPTVAQAKTLRACIDEANATIENIERQRAAGAPVTTLAP